LLSRLSAFYLKIKYRYAGELNGYTDDLSGMIEDKRAEIGLTHERASFVVNQVKLGSASANHNQFRDPTLKWMVDMKTVAGYTCAGSAHL